MLYYLNYKPFDQNFIYMDAFWKTEEEARTFSKMVSKNHLQEAPWLPAAPWF